jgi:hypothetical protein
VPPVEPTQIATAQAAVTQVASADEGSLANVPVPHSAPQAKEGSPLPDQTGLASLIGGIFGSSQSEAQNAATKPAPQHPTARPRAVAKHAAKPTMRTASAPTPKAAPQAKVAAAPKQPELRPAMKPEPQIATAKPEAPAREPEMRTAFQSPSKPATMSGAQPVVPAGSFESRWSAFRSF